MKRSKFLKILGGTVAVIAVTPLALAEPNQARALQIHNADGLVYHNIYPPIINWDKSQWEGDDDAPYYLGQPEPKVIGGNWFAYREDPKTGKADENTEMKVDSGAEFDVTTWKKEQGITNEERIWVRYEPIYESTPIKK